MDLTTLSPLTAVLVSAAAAFVVTDIATTILNVRFVTGRWTVTRWLVTGLGWHRRDVLQRGWTTTLLDWLKPWRVLDADQGQLIDPMAATVRMRRRGWSPRDPPWADFEGMLVRLACRDLTALYRMAPDLIAAQINAAANVALDCPKVHLPLLFAMAGQQVDKATAANIDLVRDPQAKHERVTAADASTADLGSVLLHYGQIEMFREALENKFESRPQLLELRSRVETAIQQRIDAFQTSARAAAQLRDQVMYVAAAVLVLFLLDGQPFFEGWRGWLTGALVAAFLAPYFGDLRTFLRQAR
jgi:hypothetical protein